jgi:hypothetical protein
MSKRRFIPHLFLIVCFYLIIRAPLINKPLNHDEIYKTSLFLHTSPITEFRSHKNTNLKEESPWFKSWETDWRRHLVLHPPLLSTFYYFWIRVFSDSETSLRIPPLIFALAGIILLYFFGFTLFGSEVSFLSTLAITLSLSHIIYSTLAIDQIFASFILLASLLYFCKFFISEREGMPPMLLILNIIGVLIFYHYFVYLFIQTIILWFYRKRLKITKYYFIGACVLMTLFLISVVAVFWVRGHCYDHWTHNNLKTTIKAITSLPYPYVYSFHLKNR